MPFRRWRRRTRQPHEPNREALVRAIEVDGLRPETFPSHLEGHELSVRHVDGERRRSQVLSALEEVRIEGLRCQEHPFGFGGAYCRDRLDGCGRRYRDRRG